MQVSGAALAHCRPHQHRSHPNEALRLMEAGRYRHLPIVDDGKVVEIVSRFDFSGLEQDRLDEETGL